MNLFSQITLCLVGLNHQVTKLAFIYNNIEFVDFSYSQIEHIPSL